MNKIEWTDITINPLRGCTKISPACDNCYSLPITYRQQFNKNLPDDLRQASAKATRKTANGLEWTGEVVSVESQLWKLYNLRKQKKPCRVFVGSLTDVFHQNAGFDRINTIMGLMHAAPQHTFMLLTKRPELALKYCRDAGLIPWPPAMRFAEGVEPRPCITPSGEMWPKNVWMGITAENQEILNTRWQYLEKIPAWTRFISYEPALGPLKLPTYCNREACEDYWDVARCDNPECPSRTLHWVICGGETGPGARPMHPDWARGLRDQCQAAGVPFFFKHWGEWSHIAPPVDDLVYYSADAQFAGYESLKKKWRDGGYGDFPHNESFRFLPTRDHARGLEMYRVGKKAAGRLLDGREWNEIPGVSS